MKSYLHVITLFLIALLPALFTGCGGGKAETVEPPKVNVPDNAPPAPRGREPRLTDEGP